MKYLIKIVLMILFFGVGLFAKDVASVVGLRGDAFLQRDMQKIEVSLGLKLQEKDTVFTGNDAKVQIIFEDETIITLGKNSKFSIDEYLFEDKQKPVAKFAMLKGAMRTITGRIGKIAPEKFSVTTKTATIGIRGTNFTVVYGENDSENVYCTYGSISVVVQGVEYVVQQGFYIHIENTKAEVKEFSAKELKDMKSKSFGSSKLNSMNGRDLDIDGLLDIRPDADVDIVIKDISDQVQDGVQNKVPEEEIHHEDHQQPAQGSGGSQSPGGSQITPY